MPEPDPLPAIKTPWGSAAPPTGAGAGEVPPLPIPDHTLVRRIGKGSYGEVWLARNVLGVYRAVKIIHRGSFDDARPFEREFAGMQRFEPVSRSHESQLNILQVGRGQDCFYYVMELADDMGHGAAIDEASYTPRNLRSELLLRGRLPVDECFRLGLALTTALEHLHRHGLVHRDIKPSNIVFVNGIPKLADIGLVAQAEATMSFVGTEGYLPPEGPGTVQADLFSLGKVLYELSTGRDRQQFPELPTGITELPDRAALAELNEVLLRACAPDVKHRYESAAEMHADLALLQSGKSVARMRAVERRLRFVQRAGAVVTVIAALAAGLYFWQSRQMRVVSGLAAEKTELAREQSRLRNRAEAEKQVARQRAYGSDMNLAQQALALSNLGRARELLDRQRPLEGEKDLRGWEWRYLWQQCQSDALFTIKPEGFTVGSLALSHDGKWLAIGENGDGRLSVWDTQTRQWIGHFNVGKGDVRVAFAHQTPLLAFWSGSYMSASSSSVPIGLWDGASTRHIPNSKLTGPCQGLWFSGDDQLLITFTAAPDNELAVWQISTGKKVCSVTASHDGGREGTGLAVSRDLSVAAIEAPDGWLRVFDLRNSTELWKAKAGDERVNSLALSEDGRTLASASGSTDPQILLWDTRTGKQLGRFQGHKSWIGQLVFTADGALLASASSDQTVRLWDVANQRSLRVFQGHNSEVWRLVIMANQKLMFSGAKDGSVLAWDLATDTARSSNVTLPRPMAAWQFSPDSKSVITLDRQGHVDRWFGKRFDQALPLLNIGPEPVDWRALISPQSRLLAVGHTNGTAQVWDLEKPGLLGEFSGLSRGTVVPVGFLAKDTRLLVLHMEDTSFHEWDLRTGTETRAWKSPPNINPFGPAFLSPNEQHCLVPESRWLRDLANGTEKRLEVRMEEVDGATFSPDGRRFAIASYLGLARMWETQDWKELATLSGFSVGVHSVAFSPDSERLATGSAGKEAVKLWDTHSFQELLTLEGKGGVFLRTAFSHNGNILGSMNKLGVVHLWSAPSWEEIAAVGANWENSEARQH